MGILDKISKGVSLTGSTLASLVKVPLLSRRPSTPSRPKADGMPHGDIVILGNGPSLRDTMASHPDFLDRHPLLAVNFFANTPEFFSLKPEFYVLADPHFFEENSSDQNVVRLWKNIGKTDWHMVLYLPANLRKSRIAAKIPDFIEIKWWNATPVEGFKPVSRFFYNAGLGMPRPRNVLIPSIMIALRENFRNIYLAGADHSWTRTLSVDADNHVVSIQPHFYADSDKEKQRVSTEYRGYHLHDILHSLTVAFSSYFAIANYAATLGARIVNVTPGSFIDAFPKVDLSTLENEGDIAGMNDKTDISASADKDKTATTDNKNTD